MTKYRFLMPLVLAVTFLAVPLAQGAEPVKIGGSFEVEAVKDVAYFSGEGADPIKHKLDIYVPKGQKDFPVLFFVHGGTWKSGDKKLYEPLGNVFGKNGIGVVVTNYRLSPQVKHPGHIEDVARAFAWTHANIAKHGGRTDQIFCCGHSAGGHLVSLLATDESYLKTHKLALSNIKGAIPMSGVYTILPGLFNAQFGSDAEVCKKASPLNNVKEKHPPFLLIYADKDFPFIDAMSEQMGESLKKCQCDVATLKIKDRDHISIIVNVQKEEDVTTQAMLAFIAKHSGLKLKVKE